jgi:hypothetical protein
MRQRSDAEQRRLHDLLNETLVEKKLSLRTAAHEEPTVAALLAVLKTLDATHARAAPPYDAIEDAIKRAWRHEARQASPSSPSLIAYVQQCID